MEKLVLVEKPIQKSIIPRENISLMLIATIKCMCPVFRDEQWNPEIKWNTVNSGEYLNDTAAVEVL